MSGAMRRIGEYLGLLEDTGRYDEYVGDDDHTVETQAFATARAGRSERRESRASVSDLSERRRPMPVPSPERAAEMTRIITLHPSTYNEARTVGEHFRDGTPVIMNLTEMGDADAKRLVDFAAGLVFATRGTIERVTNKVFLLSPPNVTVTAEDRARMTESGFFNQS